MAIDVGHIVYFLQIPILTRFWKALVELTIIDSVYESAWHDRPTNLPVGLRWLHSTRVASEELEMRPT